MLWPANGEMGMLRVEEGKRVEKTFGVQAPLAKRRDVQGTNGCVSLDGKLARWCGKEAYSAFPNHR